jgi:hypothetical protein
MPEYRGWFYFKRVGSITLDQTSIRVLVQIGSVAQPVDVRKKKK